VGKKKGLSGSVGREQKWWLRWRTWVVGGEREKTFSGSKAMGGGGLTDLATEKGRSEN